LKILFRAFRDASWEHDQARNEYGRLVQEAHEHLAIVEALRAGNRREAVLAMSRHIMSGSTYWTRALPGSAEPEPRKNRHTSVNGNGEHR
jgi:DNA-binding GntR family transcriptional regulator